MRLFIYLFFILTLTNSSFCSTRGDVKILEATENIQYLSQKIATDCILLYKNPKDILLKKEIDRSINNLLFYIKDIKDIKDIQEYTEGILEYFEINTLQKIQNEKIDLPKVKNVLKYSEIILEGAKSISKEHRYKFSKEEKMLMLNQEILYLLQRINKYYIAISIGLNNHINYIKMRRAILKLDNRLKIMNNYKYPKDLKYTLNEINELWSRDRELFYQVKELSIPYLLYTSSRYVETLVKKIEKYHKKNL